MIRYIYWSYIGIMENEIETAIVLYGESPRCSCPTRSGPRPGITCHPAPACAGLERAVDSFNAVVARCYCRPMRLLVVLLLLLPLPLLLIPILQLLLLQKQEEQSLRTRLCLCAHVVAATGTSATLINNSVPRTLTKTQRTE